MSKGSGSGNAGTTTTATNSSSGPPQYVQNWAANLYGDAQGVADSLKPASVAQVAPLTGGQQNLIGQLQGNVGSQNGNYAQAQGTLNGLQGYQNQNVTAGQLSNTDLSPYMNPYTQDVINTTMATGQQALAQAQNQGAASAAGAGAFGGSRQGVQAGVTGSQYALGQAQMAAGLNQANFNQAQGAASQDIGTRMAADTTNAGNAINSAGLRLNAANSGVNAAGQQQQTYLNGLMAALGGQGMLQQQQQAQNQYTADVANAGNQLGQQQLGIKTGTLEGLPFGTQTTGMQTAQTEQPSSTFGQILGGGLGGIGSLGSAFGKNGFDIGSMLSTAAPLAMAASDRRLKKDIQKIGTHEGTGLDMYAYRYKGDPENSLKVVGPMAQDIEEKFPDQVVEVAGRKTVNPAFLNGLMMSR